MSPESKKRLNGWAQFLATMAVTGAATLGGWMYFAGGKINQVDQNTQRYSELKEVHRKDMNEMKAILTDIRQDVRQLAEDSAYDRGLRERRDQ